MEPTDRASRLKFARERANFESPRAAAKHFRWNENTYKAREAGLRDYTVEDARVYGRAFEVSWIWLVSGEGGTERKSVAQISGLIGAGGEVDTNLSQAYGDEVVEVEVLVPLPPDVSAYEVWGDSMLPKYDPGDIVIVKNTASPPELLLDEVALVITGEGKRYLKRILKGAEEGYYDLESFNARPMKNMKILRAGAVHLIIPAKQVERIANGKEIERRYRVKDEPNAVA
ncbi:S24/S26 family peptidase [Methylobacterium sp. CM6247]